jgi:hypothetical protein
MVPPGHSSKLTLGDGHADGVINPADAFAGNAGGDDVICDRVHGMEKLDLKTAAGLPGAAVGPTEFAVNIGEGIPTMAIGKHEPGEGLNEELLSDLETACREGVRRLIGAGQNGGG